MQRRRPFITVVVILSCLLASEAVAQSGLVSAQALPSSMSDTTLLRSGTLFGYRVKSPQGEDLGKIEDVMIDMEMKRIAYAIISFGGFLGLGDKWVRPSPGMP